MKVYVRAPNPQRCLEELGTMFGEVVYEPWTSNGERFYEDEMLENLLRVQPDVLITELDRITPKVLNGYDKLRFIGDCRATPANIQVDACTQAGVPVLCTPGRNTQAVAELVVGLMVVFLRNAIPAIQWAKDGKYLTGVTVDVKGGDGSTVAPNTKDNVGKGHYGGDTLNAVGTTVAWMGGSGGGASGLKVKVGANTFYSKGGNGGYIYGSKFDEIVAPGDGLRGGGGGSGPYALGGAGGDGFILLIFYST